MWIIRIESHDRPDHDKRTFKCPECKHFEVLVVQYR